MSRADNLLTLSNDYAKRRVDSSYKTTPAAVAEPKLKESLARTFPSTQRGASNPNYSSNRSSWEGIKRPKPVQVNFDRVQMPAYDRTKAPAQNVFSSPTALKEQAMGNLTGKYFGKDPLDGVRENVRLSMYDVDSATKHKSEYEQERQKIKQQLSAGNYVRGVVSPAGMPGKEDREQLLARDAELEKKIGYLDSEISKAKDIQAQSAAYENSQRLLRFDVESAKHQKAAIENQISHISETIGALQDAINARMYGDGNISREEAMAEIDYLDEITRLTELSNKRKNELSQLQQTIYQAEQMKATQQYYSLMDNEDFDYYAAQGAAIVERDNYANRDLYLQTAKMSDPNPGMVGTQRDIEQAAEQNLGDKDRRGLDIGVPERYRYMTKDEVNIYCYLLAKEGRASAQEYLHTLEETLNARYGAQVGENVRNIDSDFVRNMATAGGAIVSGVDQFGRGAAQMFTDERIPTSAVQYASQTIRDDLSKGGRIAYDLLNTAANMAPSILVSSLLSPAAGAVTMGVSAAGNAYNQALGEGYSKKQARTYGVLVGASEAVLQNVLGGIGKLGGMSGKIAKAVSRIDNALYKVAAQSGLEMLSEAGEEYLQSVLEPLYRNLIFGENNNIDLLSDEALYSALLGALSGGVMNAPANVSNFAEAVNERTNQQRIEAAIADIMQNNPQSRQTADPQVQMDKVMQDVVAQNKTAPVAETETEEAAANEAIAVSPETGSTSSSAAAGADVTIAKSDAEINRKWQNFLEKHNGNPKMQDWLEFVETLDDADAEAFSSFLAEQEKAGKLKWRGDGAPGVVMPAEDHIDNRDMGSVGDTKVKSFQYNNPEVHEYIAKGAEILSGDVAASSPGQRFYDDSTRTWSGQKRTTTPEIAKMKDDYNMSWADIDKALSDIVEDEGKENYAKAKRVEIIIDDILSNGYRTLDGRFVPPNPMYIKTKQGIAGAAQHETGIYEAAGENYWSKQTSSITGEIRPGDEVSAEYFGETGHGMVLAVNPDGTYLVKVNDRRLPDPITLSADQIRKDGLPPMEEQNTETTAANPAMGAGVGDMGAKTSDFRHEVKESQTAKNTIGKNEARWNVPKDARTEAAYDAVTEEESINNAKLRLVQDTLGEMVHLKNTAAWTNEEVDMGMLILASYRREAKVTGDWSEYKDWAKVVKEHGVTAGQALQAWAKYTRKADLVSVASGLLEKAKAHTDIDAVLNTVSEFADRYESAVDSNDVDSLVQIIRDTSNVRKTGTLGKNKMPREIDWALNRIAEMAKKDENAYSFLQIFAAAGIEDIAGDHQRVSVGNAVKTIRYNAMLSKVATVLRNLVGNGVFDGLDTISRDISVPLDMLLSKFTGTRSIAVDKYYFSEAKRKGSLDGLAMALMEAGLDVNADGATNKHEGSSNRTFKMSGNALSRLMSAWEKWTAYNMQVSDELSKGGTRAEIQRGIDELYAQRKIKDDSLRDAGQQTALYRTFQDDTVLSKMTTGFRNIANELHAGDFGAGDMTMPFAKIPANLASRVIDYSPIGVLKGITQLLYQGAKGTLTAADQAKAVQNIGRGVTGTGLIIGFTALAAKGIIRAIGAGGEEDNKDKVAAEKAQGVTGTQFNISAAQRWINGEDATWRDGDTLVSIGFLDPINAHMAMGALIAEDMKDGLTYTELQDDTLAGIVQAVGDLPVMQTIKDAANAFQYSDADNAGGKLRDATSSYLAGQVTSFIPNSIKGIAQGLDSTQRDAYTSDSLWGQTVDNIKASIPGLRNTLPAKLDSYGREMKNEGGFRNFMNSNVNPGAVTTYHEDAVDRMVKDLYEASKGDTSIYPDRKAPSSIDIGGETVKLTPDQKREYQKNRGSVEHDVKNALSKNATLSGLSTETQMAALKSAEDYAKQKAKEGLGIGYEADTWVRELDGASEAEVAKALVGRAMDSVGGYGDKASEQNYRNLIYSPAMAVVSGDVQDKAFEYAVQYNDAIAKEDMGYPIETEWMVEARNIKSVRDRVDYFVGKAVESLAKKAGDGKYDGISNLLDAGTIDDRSALLACSPTVVDAYTAHCKGAKVPTEKWLDVYGYANSQDGTTKEKREKGLKYIEMLSVPAKKKVALAKALYAAMKGYIPYEADIPKEWLRRFGG